MTTAHLALWPGSGWPSPDQVRRKSLISGTVGAIIEWYEYTVYGTAAALVFGTLFFPSTEPAYPRSPLSPMVLN